MKYIRGFDSLRAISILFVLLTHLGLFALLPEGLILKNRLWELISGNTGVRIFFTLSGFLITSILLVEREKKGSINFKRFYIRRLLRLLPPLVLFFMAVFILMKMGKIQDTNIGLFFSMFYLYNFAPYAFQTAELGHTWSLALEEQFYILWPLALEYIRKSSTINMLIFIVISLCVFATFLYPTIDLNYFYKPERWFIPAIAPVLAGSLIAIFNLKGSFKWIGRLKSKGISMVLGLFLFAYPIYTPLEFFNLSFIFQSFGIALILFWIFHNQGSILVNFLENKVLNYIGKISYGLYVYQGLFLTTGPSGTIDIQKFPLNIILTFSAAALSYQFLEKPILKLKEKFH